MSGYEKLPGNPSTTTTTRKQNMKRQDLQGIRGIAIGAVVLFHFFPQTFPNGYVGVDIFFVLSGFLMTMIFGSKQLNRSSISLFYQRRIKRIVPLYVAIIFTVIFLCFFLFPPTFREINVSSAIHAATLTTNLVSPSTKNSYFVQLEQADDLFTHTWSLAVEMQFYLFVPPLFALFSFYFSLSFSAVFGASLAFHLFSSPHSSFNSVFSRIWQFQMGTLAFYIGQSLSEYFKEGGSSSEDNETLLSNEEKESPSSRENSSLLLLYSLCLVALLLLCFLPISLPAVFARLPSTLLSSLIISLGAVVSRSWLSFPSLVYLGDISYSFYLVHWPIYVWVKYFYKNEFFAYCLAILVCFILSVWISETYEKWYQKLDMKAIVLLILVFYAAVFIAVYEKDDLARLADGPERAPLQGSLLGRNISAEDAIDINNDFDRFEYPNLVIPNCFPNTSEHGFCSFPMGEGKPRILILGNSYAANLGEVIYDNFKEIGGNISKYSNSFCDSMLQNKKGPRNCPKSYFTYLQVAQKFKPDILFLINRHMITGTTKFDPTNAYEDPLVQELKNTIKSYEAMTTTRVYIMDAIPFVPTSHIRDLNTKIKNNQPFKADETIQTYKIAQQRMKFAAQNCTKCVVFNMNSVFVPGSETILADKKTRLSYFTSGVHLTAAGKEAVAPIFRQLAEEFKQKNSGEQQRV